MFCVYRDTTLSDIINTETLQHAKHTECLLWIDWKPTVTNDLDPESKLYKVSSADDEHYTVTSIATANKLVIRPEAYYREFWNKKF